MSIEYRVGDVFDRLAEIPDGSMGRHGCLCGARNPR